MTSRLAPHPASQRGGVHRIAIHYDRPRKHVLSMRYIVWADAGALKLPEPQPSERAGKLWEHTCFEVFVWAAMDRAYTEFNFSPSTQWAAYRFDDLRQGMRDAETEARISVERRADELTLHAEVTIPDERVWRIKPAAVIEAANGEKSYWAFSHPEGPPNFHSLEGYEFLIPRSE